MKRLLILAALLVLLPTFADSADVPEYMPKEGTYIAPYQPSIFDSDLYNSYNFPGNYNPNKGQITPGDRNIKVELYREQQRQHYMNRPNFDWRE